MKRWLSFHSVATGVHRQNQSIDKESFAQKISNNFQLSKARSVYHAPDFAVRFCYSNDAGFSNCVLSLAALRAFDDRPFLVCLLKPSGVTTYLANTSLIKKVSHSSHQLSMQNIKGTILGHDIARELDGMANTPENFESLYESHCGFTWNDNLERIVSATSSIAATGRRFVPDESQLANLRKAGLRSVEAETTGLLSKIERQLTELLTQKKLPILNAAQTDNVNLRGNAIEQIVTGAKNFHKLEDSVFEVTGALRVVVDVKTKILELSSSPKLYNIDKTLRELANGSVFCFFIVGISRKDATVTGRLVDILDSQMIKATRVQFHWAGRNSRGVTQLTRDAGIFFMPGFRRNVDLRTANEFLQVLLKDN